MWLNLTEPSMSATDQKLYKVESLIGSGLISAWEFGYMSIGEYLQEGNSVNDSPEQYTCLSMIDWFMFLVCMVQNFLSSQMMMGL